MLTLNGKPVFIVSKRIDYIYGLGYHVQHCKADGNPFYVGERPKGFKQYALVLPEDLEVHGCLDAH